MQCCELQGYDETARSDHLVPRCTEEEEGMRHLFRSILSKGALDLLLARFHSGSSGTPWKNG